MEDAASSPPYWQLPATVTHRRGQSSSLSSAFLNSSIAIVLIPSLAMFLLFIVVPTITASHPNPYSPSLITKPVQMKNGLATLNVVLVAFAILCGILSRENHHESSSLLQEQIQNHESFIRSAVPRNNKERVLQLFGEEDNVARPVAGVSTMRRSTSSSPDLRNQDLWETTGTSERLPFFDDFHLKRFYPLKYDNLQELGDEITDIPVETIFSSSEQRLSPPPLERRRVIADERIPETVAANLPARSPSTEPEEEEAGTGEEEEKKKRKQKKKTASKEIANALTSLYSRRRKRKRNHKIVHDFETSVESLPPQSTPPPPRPPPPPPPLRPPSSSVFQSLFKKKSKSKTIHSLTPQQPQPSPPPPQHFSQSQKQKNPIASRSNDQSPPRFTPINRTAAQHRPPNSPIIGLGEDMVDETHSPRSPVPPPTPPPPPETNCESRGDFARVQPRKNVDELGAVDDERWWNEIDGEDENGRFSSVGWPSPDVNAKADKFIARHHEGWKRERLVSRGKRETRWADEDAYWAHLGP